MATLLINTSDLASIPFFSNNNHGVHNSNGVEAYMLKEALENKFMKTFNVSYN
jgi:hypothetical protein